MQGKNQSIEKVSADQNRVKFTPGPWIATKSSHDREWSHWIESGTESTRRLVAAVGNDNLRAGDNESNARLIACAPELIAALKRMVTAYTIGGLNDARPAKEYARSVIAKVEAA